MLDPADSATSSGSGESNGLVVLGRFELAWSYASPSCGYLYYPHDVEEVADLEMCMTSLRRLDLPIDTADERFEWRTK